MTTSCMHRAAVLLIAMTVLFLAPLAASAKPGQSCGGFVGPVCGKGEFCQEPAGRCFIFNLPGTCVRKPYVCPKYIRPVCGCDGKTYSNDCRRQQAGVSKMHDGRCL